MSEIDVQDLREGDSIICSGRPLTVSSVEFQGWKSAVYLVKFAEGPTISVPVGQKLLRSDRTPVQGY